MPIALFWSHLSDKVNFWTYYLLHIYYEQFVDHQEIFFSGITLSLKVKQLNNCLSARHSEIFNLDFICCCLFVHSWTVWYRYRYLLLRCNVEHLYKPSHSSSVKNDTAAQLWHLYLCVFSVFYDICFHSFNLFLVIMVCIICVKVQRKIDKTQIWGLQKRQTEMLPRWDSRRRNLDVTAAQSQTYR